MYGGDTGECHTGGLALRHAANWRVFINIDSNISPLRFGCRYIPQPMAESPVLLLRAHARLAPWNARGLAAHAASLVDAAGMKPTNASARAAPSARAVRYYVANRLLDRPEGAGTSATYGYRHLIQLLGIKIRQREGQTLDAIKSEMREVTGDALERRVAQALAPALSLNLDAARNSNNGDGLSSWRRIPIADGVELHVRDDSPASRDELLMAMKESLRATLERNNFVR